MPSCAWYWPLVRSRSPTTPDMSTSMTVKATGTASAFVIWVAIARRMGDACLSESPSATGDGAAGAGGADGAAGADAPGAAGAPDEADTGCAGATCAAD